MSTAAPRVAAYGFFGIGNLGNEASLSALLRYLRAEHPQAELSCFAVGADAVERDHGIPATQLMTYARLGQGTGRRMKARKAASRLWDVPRTLKMVGGVDVVVVPGTGALETQLGVPPWGLPYWLFLLTLACRLRGRKVALVSVGAQYATHPLTRFFYRWTVRWSHYCSFRDGTSREAVSAMGVDGPLGPIYPDLAFSLPTPQGRAVRPGHIVIGVMAYYGKADDPVRGAGVRRQYVERMARFAAREIEEGRTITMVIGDLADQDVALEIETLVRRARPDLRLDQLRVSNAVTFEDIMREMAEAELVVASRFHNIIGALKLAKPTVSLGYAQKNASLLEQFGYGEYVQAMDELDPDLLVDQVAHAEESRAAQGRQITSVLARFESDLDEQFRTLSTGTFVPGQRRQDVLR